MDPPPEYGVAVNFGSSNVGSGNVQPNTPIKSEPLDIEKPTEEAKVEETKEEVKEEVVEEKTEDIPEEPKKIEETTKADKAEKVLTQEAEEALKLKKQKEAEATKAKKEAAKKAKAEADRKAKAEAKKKAAKAAAEKKKREQDAKKKKLDALMGGLNKSDGKAQGGEGNDNKAGDKGQLDGDPYAPSYFGSGSGRGGVGYGLNGRGKPSRSKVVPECQEEGRVVVEIHVNRQGNVVKAIPGVRGTTGHSCLFDAAKKTALSHKWKPDAKAPTKQIGFVKIDFRVGQ